MYRWRFLALTMVLGVVLAACGGAPGGSPEPTEAEETAAETAAETEAPEYEGMVYPEEGPAECGAEATDEHAAYTGQIAEIRAEDERTVVFTLCQPDVAFLSKIAFASFAINDTAYLEEAVPDGSIVEQPNGTGPYRLAEWVRGDHLTLEAFEDYWGDAPVAPTVIFRWSAEAAQRLIELQSATVDGIDNPGPEDFETIEGDENLALYPRPGLNVFYIGFNNNPQVEGFDNTTNPFANEQVRQALAMGIDRQRIVDAYYPPGSEVASHFTPCEIAFGCTGDEWYEFDLEAARQMLADAGYPNGFTTQIHLRDVVRGYLPEPVAVATEIQTQLAALGITAELDVQESGTFIDNADAGRLPGIHLLGWGADYPDVTNFLDFHFGAGASQQFGDKFDDITGPLQEGASSVEDEDREAAYTEANDAIREHVPMIPVAHGGSATAFRADVEGAHSSPLSNETFAVMSGGADDQLVWMQNAEPIGLYCADESDGESLRACEQMMESLYAYEVGGTDAIPSLAEECVPNDALDEWTCTLREGVTFHDGSTLDANDVVLSYAVQWDAEHPLHKGRDNSFTYWGGLFGGFLNAPLPEE